MSNPVVLATQKLLADQRIRFLIVGGINTLAGIALFSLFEITIGHYLGRFGYLVSLVLAYAIGICIAFTLHRRFVFKVKGNLWVDFGRFTLTNLLGFGLNALILPLLVEGTHLVPIAAQAIATFLVAMVTYFAHKHFSFRRKPQAH